MPLPAALAARLAKRGILSKEQVEESQIKEDEDNEEEVFAENYDDTSYKPEAASTSPAHSDEEAEDVQDHINLKFKGHPGCPNKSNIFHECTKYCKTKWKDGKKFPDKAYLRKKNKMLQKYPLPEHWKEVYDPGYGRFYYWDTQTDNVSWLAPDHPKAIITDCAAVLKEETHLAEGDRDTSSEDSEEEEEEDFDDEAEEKRKQEEKRRKKEAQEKARSKGRSKKKENDLDPMDPAAYSDIARGTWGDGLDKHNEAKTGADTTASGPLYQMRPYPSPGDILRANKRKKPSSEQDEDSP